MFPPFDGEEEYDSGVFPRRLPRAASQPGEPVYPLPAPDLRQRRHPQFEQLIEEIIRAFGRRDAEVFPPILTRADRIRLEVMLWRFLYSPEWPHSREGR